MENVRLLLIEDSPADARLIQELLRDASESFEVTTVTRLGSALELIESEDFDIVLLDLFLPDSQGMETFEEFQLRAPSLPLIVLTGLSDENLGVHTVKSGAQDYLPKGDVSTALLSRSIRYSVERHRTRQALEANEARMRALLNAVPQAIVIENTKGGIVMLNDQACQQFGYGRSELFGLSVESLLAPDCLERYRAARAEAIQIGNGAEPLVGLHGVAKDGTRFPVEISHSLVSTPIGQRIICLIEDVTAHHQLVSRLRGGAANGETTHSEQDGAVVAKSSLARERAWLDEMRG